MLFHSLISLALGVGDSPLIGSPPLVFKALLNNFLERS